MTHCLCIRLMKMSLSLTVNCNSLSAIAFFGITIHNFILKICCPFNYLGQVLINSYTVLFYNNWFAYFPKPTIRAFDYFSNSFSMHWFFIVNWHIVFYKLFQSFFYHSLQNVGHHIIFHTQVLIEKLPLRSHSKAYLRMNTFIYYFYIYKYILYLYIYNRYKLYFFMVTISI